MSRDIKTAFVVSGSKEIAVNNSVALGSIQKGQYQKINDNNDNINIDANKTQEIITKNDNKSNNTKMNELSFWKESKAMFRLTFPVSIASISRLVMQNIDTMFLGHIGTDALAGASLAAICIEMATLFVYSPTFSVTSLCAQAIGANNPKYAGYWLQLTIVLCTLLTIPSYIFYFYIANIINIFSSSSNVTYYASIYAHFSALYLWTSAMCGIMRGFFQSLEIVHPFTIISVISIGLNIIYNYIFVSFLGFIGSPIATAISFLIQLLLYYIWCIVIKQYHIKHNVWPGWSFKKSFELKKILNFIKVIVPNAISDASENWAYQIVVLVCATLPSADVAALSCLFDVWATLWAFYSGFGAAVETKVAKQIGAGNIYYAQYLSKLGLILTLSVCIFVAGLLYLLSDKLVLLYSNDKNVQNTMKNCIPIICIIYIIDVIGWSASGILQAMSRNRIRGFVCTASAWLIFLPMAIYSVLYSKWSISQRCPICCIFGAALIVETFRSITLWIIVYKTNWKKVCIEAQQRNESELLLLDNDSLINNENKDSDNNNNNINNNNDDKQKKENEKKKNMDDIIDVVDDNKDDKNDNKNNDKVEIKNDENSFINLPEMDVNKINNNINININSNNNTNNNNNNNNKKNYILLNEKYFVSAV